MIPAIRKTMGFLITTGLFLAGLATLAACSPMPVPPTSQLEALVATAFLTPTPTRTLIPTPTLDSDFQIHNRNRVSEWRLCLYLSFQA